MREKLRMTAALFGTVLPTLVASAAQPPPKLLTRDQAVDACVEYKEKALACKDELADHFAAMAPPERRAKIREKALAEIIQEGSGPLEPRRLKCAVDVEGKGKGPLPLMLLTDQDLAALRACESKEACKERIACGTAIIKAARQRQ